MKKIGEMSLGELAAFIASHLMKNNIAAVLSGGACVSIFTQNRYQSFDLDFIETLSTSRKKMRDIMSQIGFIEDARYYKNPDTQFYVEFPPGPLTVGDEPVKEIVEREFDTGILRLLSPTECIKDRLAGYYHWHDMQCLKQAIMVAENEPINIREIKRWSVNEGKSVDFDKIRESLIKAQKKRS